jgi:N-acetylglucosaminyl-diphospho-decaprenol L-rhamnosyltransferase
MNHYKEISVLLVLYQEDINLIKKNLINFKNFKIIIIDNDSNLELKKKIEKDFYIHKYIVNPQNNGYTKALNQAIRACDTKYAITINADCNISEFSILKLFEGYQKYQNCFITSPISYSKDLKLTYSAGGFPELFFNNKPIAISGDVCFQIVLGSAMFFETKKMIKIGLLDENFFIYYSDYDLCRRINQIKMSVIQIKEAYCTHQHGISKVRNKYKRIFLRENNYIFDELYYFYKINAHSIILLGLKKKIFKYFIKIFSNFLILELEKTILFSARVFAYFRFLLLIKKNTP